VGGLRHGAEVWLAVAFVVFMITLSAGAWRLPLEPSGGIVSIERVGVPTGPAWVGAHAGDDYFGPTPSSGP
jgi:hypothetical protein